MISEKVVLMTVLRNYRAMLLTLGQVYQILKFTKKIMPLNKIVFVSF